MKSWHQLYKQQHMSKQCRDKADRHNPSTNHQRKHKQLTNKESVIWTKHWVLPLKHQIRVHSRFSCCSVVPHVLRVCDRPETGALRRLLAAGWKAAAAACLVLLAECSAADLRPASPLFERWHWAQVWTRKSLLSFLVALCCELRRRHAECDTAATKPAAEEEECVCDGGTSEVGARRGGSHGAPEPSWRGLFNLWPLREERLMGTMWHKTADEEEEEESEKSSEEAAP